LEVDILSDIHSGRKDKDRSHGHQKNDNHGDTIGNRIVSCRSDHDDTPIITALIRSRNVYEGPL